MDVSVTPAELAEKSIVDRLLQLYHYDFTEFVDIKLGADGTYPYRYLDVYWDPEPGEERYPFLIRLDGDLAGFAFVRFLNGHYLMAEFFVMRPFRRAGVGAVAAAALFQEFPGPWIVHQVPKNLPAQAFWRRVIGDFTSGRFDESTDADGVTQRFTSGG